MNVCHGFARVVCHRSAGPVCDGPAGAVCHVSVEAVRHGFAENGLPLATSPACLATALMCLKPWGTVNPNTLSSSQASPRIASRSRTACPAISRHSALP